MARQTSRQAKTETLSLRLDPRTKFILEFIARLRGQSITTVVERAIWNAADNAKVGDEQFGAARTWRDFWDYNEPIRFLKLVSDQDVPNSFEEEEILRFVEEHADIFGFNRKSTPIVDIKRANVLWPRINEFVAMWRETRSTDPARVRNLMKRTLAEAGLNGPTPAPKPTAKPKADEDDDIPF